MFAGFRRHQKWIWIIAIIVIIPSFVIFFSNTSVLTGGGKRGDVGSINGRPVGRDEYINARSEANLSYFFRVGSWPGRDESTRQYGFDAERETTGRLLMIEELNRLKINVSTASTIQLAGELLERISGGRAAGAEVLDAFTKQVLQPNGLDKDDFERFVQHEAGILHLVSVVGTPGRLTTPQEAEMIYRRENGEVIAEAVFFSTSNYLAQVQLSPDMVNTYYTNNMATYRVRDRVQVAYAKLDITNYLADADVQMGKITNLNERIKAMYYKRGTNFYTDSDGKTLSEEAALEKIKTESRDEMAIGLARKKAFDLGNQLAAKAEAGNAKLRLEDLTAVATAGGLTVKYTEPFDDEGPKSLKVNTTFAKASFQLTSEDPIATMPVVGEDGVYLIGLKEKFPSSIPPLAVVREKVTQDCRMFQARDSALAAAQIFENTLTNGLAQNKTFTAICLDGKQKSVLLPAFSRSTRSLEDFSIPVSLNELKRYVFNLAPGKSSPVVATADGAMIVYMRSRLPVKEDKLKEEMPAFTATIRQNRLFEAADIWLQKQRQSMQVDLPSSDKSKPKK